MPDKNYLIVRNGESQSYSADDFNSPEIQGWLGENKDAESYEMSAYNPEDETLDGDFFQIYNKDGEFENYTRDDIESPEMQEWIKKNPSFRVARIRPAGPWGEGIRKEYAHQNAMSKLAGTDAEYLQHGEEWEKVDAIKQQLDEKRQALENYDKKSDGPSKRELKRQIKELEGKYYGSNLVIQENRRMNDINDLADKDLERAYEPYRKQAQERREEREKNVGIHATPYGFGAYSDMPTYEDNLYTAAKNLNKDTKKLYEAPSKYVKEDGGGFFKGAWDRASEVDFWTMGLTGIQDQMQLKGVFDKIRDKIGSMGEVNEENLDEALSPMEKELLSAYVRNADAQAARAADLTGRYKAGQGAADSAQFMAQFILSGGITSGVTEMASKGSAKALSEWIAKAIGKGGAKLLGSGKFATVAAKGAGRILGDIGEGAAAMLFQPGTVKSVLEAKNQLDEYGEFVDQKAAGWRGLFDYGIEVFSEQTGDYLGNVLGAMGGNALLKGIAKTEFGKWGKAALNSSAVKMLKAGKWHGMFGEMSEEFIGAALRDLTKLDDKAWEEQTDMENIGVMALSFLPMSLIGGGVSTAKYGYARKQYNTSNQNVQQRLKNLGFTPEQIEYATDLGRMTSPEAVIENVRPIIDEMKKRGASQEDLDAVMDNAYNASVLNIYDAFEGEKIQQERDAALGDLTEAYGDFWQGDEESGRTVERVTDQDGRSGFVLNTDETGLMTVKFDDGNTGFADLKKGAQVGVSTLDQYLDSTILASKQASEAAEMQVDEQQARQELANRIAANEPVPMGTEEAPVQGKYIGRDQAGNNIVETPDGQVIMSDAELASKWGIDLTPKTREQKDADEVAEYDAAQKRKDAYNRIPMGTEIQATLEGEQEPVPYKFTRAVYDEDAQELRIYVEDTQTGQETWLPESAFPALEQQAAKYEQRAEAVDGITQEQAGEAVDQTPRDFRGNPLPLKDDGTVNQSELWNKDPEAWAMWNDSQRQDGGANSIGYVQAAASTVQKEIDEANKLYASELDFDKREAIEKEIAEKTARLGVLDSVLDGYKARAEAAKNAKKKSGEKREEAIPGEVKQGELGPEQAVNETPSATLHKDLKDIQARKGRADGDLREAANQLPDKWHEALILATRETGEKKAAAIAELVRLSGENRGNAAADAVLEAYARATEQTPAEQKTPEQIAQEKAQAEAEAEAERQKPLEARANNWQKRTGQKVVLIHNFDEIPESEVAARAAIRLGKDVAGWYNPNTDQVMIYLPKNVDEADVDKTFMHEVIAHKGLKDMLATRDENGNVIGYERFNELLDHTWNDIMSEEDREFYMNYARIGAPNAKKEDLQRIAADEYIAHLAENIDSNPTAWEKFVAKLVEILNKILETDLKISNEDLKTLLQASLARYEEQAKNGKEDAALRIAIEKEIGGGIDVSGNKSDQTRFSIKAITDGSGLSVIEDDGKGNVAFKTPDGRVFDSEHHITAEDLKALPNTVMGYMMADARRVGTVTEKNEDTIWNSYAAMLNLMLDRGAAENGITGKERLAATWEWEVENTVYKSVSTNSDAQYSYSLDITRVCKKNEAVIKAISAMQRQVGYGITPGQIMDLYLSGIEEGYQVPCPVCYVFSRYIDNGKYATIAINGQHKYGDRLVDPATLSEEEKQERIKFWLSEMERQDELNKKNAKQIAKAKKDIKNIIQEINALSERITNGSLQGEEREAAIRRVHALDALYRDAFNVVSQSSLSQWIKSFAIYSENGEWKLYDDTFQGFPPEYALDLRLTADTIRDYPGIQRLRKSGGSAAGKEIHFASNNDLGQVPMMVGASDLKKTQNYYKLAANATDEVERAELLDKASKRFDAAHRYAQQQSLRGGQRMWSWSDNIERLAPDVYINMMQMQLLGGAVQSYSKQLEGVNLVASMGAYVNGSLMGYGKGYQVLEDGDVATVDGKEVLAHDITDTVTEKTAKGPVERTRALAKAGSPVFEFGGQKMVLVFDDVIGIDPYGRDRDGKHLKGLFDLNSELDKAGNIIVGMNDDHIRVAMADERIFFIIPWHASGNSVHIVQQMLSYLGVETDLKDFKDYTPVQEEKDVLDGQINPLLIDFWEAHRNETDFPSGIKGGIPSSDGRGHASRQQRHYRELRDAIFLGVPVDTGKVNKDGEPIYKNVPVAEAKPAWLKEILADAFLSQVYRNVQERVDAKQMTNGDTKAFYSYEYWDENSTFDTADVNGARYLEYCRRLGYKPVFVGRLDGKADDFGNFADDKGYWKLLIDRRMYGVDGKFQGLTPTTTEGFRPEMTDPKWTGENFEVTKVADEPGAERIAERTIAREQANMPGGVPTIDYDTDLDSAVEKYEATRAMMDEIEKQEKKAAKKSAKTSKKDVEEGGRILTRIVDSIGQKAQEKAKDAMDAAGQVLEKTGYSFSDQRLLDAYGLESADLSKKGDVVTLTNFKSRVKGQGNGTRFMTDLAEMADKNGWTLTLTPSKDFGASSLARLKDFYKRFGFKENKGKNTDFTINESMIRRPGAPVKQMETEEDRETNELFSAAKKRFGTTRDLREAGYILPDGTLLDFSGRHQVSGDSSYLKGSRHVDHRDIADLNYEDDLNTPSGIDTSMVDFINRGAVRIDGDSGSINLAVKPTDAQMSVIRRIIERTGGEAYIDFGADNTDHYAEYEGARPDRVVNDIRRYFDEGYKPDGNVMFRISTKSPEAEEAAVRFRVVEDPLKIAELEAKPKVPVYRSAQFIEDPNGEWEYDFGDGRGKVKGNLYAPMSAKVNGEWREPIHPNQWEEAEENPELADEKGEFMLNKGNGKGMSVAYAPYLHHRRSPLNEQFSEAYNRPNLVIVKSEVPESELSSGYTAKKSKKSTGEHDWASGKVSNELARRGKNTRKVILSRWSKPTELVPASDVADEIVNLMGDKKIPFQYNVVTPSLRRELMKRGVEFEGWQGNKPKNADQLISQMKEENEKSRKETRETQETLVKEANAKQKQPISEKIDQEEARIEEPEIMFRISKNNKATIESWLKKRTDISDEEREAVVDYIDGLDDAKTQLATARWYANGTIRIPEDMDKVKQAVSVAGKAKVDPLRYSSPMELLDAHADFKPTAERINPDDVPTLHRAEEYPEGIVVYDVDEGEDSRQNMRKIINTHFGEDASPWCLLQGDGKGNLTADSAKYWRHYNAYPKQVAFKDGKLLAFSANDSGTKVWWDRQDESHYGIPITKKIDGDELGRSAVHVLQYEAVIRKDALERDLAHKYNCPPYRLRELASPEDIAKLDEVNREIAAQMQAGMLGFQKEGGAHPFKGNRQNGVYEEWSSDGETLLERTEYKDGKENGISETWYPNGQQEKRVTMKDGLFAGPVTYWYDNGQVRIKGIMGADHLKTGLHEQWYKNGNKRYEVHYNHGEFVGERKEWNEDGHLSTVWKYDDSGNLLGRETYLPLGDDGDVLEQRDTFADKGMIVEKFYRSGMLRSREFYETPRHRNGLQEYFYTDGTLQERYTLRDGDLDGVKEKWHPNGQLWYRENWKDGKKEGVSEYYDKDGNLETRAVYHDDELVEGDSLDVMRSRVRFRITPEQDKEYMDAVEKGDMEKAQEMVDEAAKATGYTQKAYRVQDDEHLREGGKNPNAYNGAYGGVYYAESLDYYDHTDTSYKKKDAKPYYINTEDFWDPFSQLQLDAISWGRIDGRLDEFEKYGITDEMDFEGPEDMAVTSTDGLAVAGQELGYKGTILRDIPQNGTIENFTEYAVYDSDAVKSADPVTYDDNGNVIPLSERFNDSSDDIRFLIRGYEGVLNAGDTEAEDNLAVAERMDDAGTDSHVIWLATGWEKGKDGKWRNEIPDAKYIGGDKLKMHNIAGDILDAPELFASYPQLEKMPIDLDDMSSAGGYNSRDKRIVIDRKYNTQGDQHQRVLTGEGVRTVLHELQHAIQHIEGFAKGANSKSLEREYYKNELKDNPEKATFAWMVSRGHSAQKLMRVGKTEIARQFDALDKTRYNANDRAIVEKLAPYLRGMSENEFKSFVRSADRLVKAAREAGEVGYNNSVGEVESRNVERRSRLDDAYRKLNEPSSTEDVDRKDQIVRFRMSNGNQRIFISNAEAALDKIKMDKATPEQWLKMLEKEGGLKAAEDKWLGLSQWLGEVERKTVTKQEIADFIAKNQIQIEEQRYYEDNEDYLQREYPTLSEAFSFDTDNFHDEPYVDRINNLDEALRLYNEAHPDSLIYKGENGDITDEEYDKIAGWADSILKGKRIDRTRLHYTTEGLRNNAEIALTVPTIEPWHQSDKIHFGDAGEGRAISWARFGDTWVSPAKDEAERKYREADKVFRDYRNEIIAKYALKATDTKKVKDFATDEENKKVKDLQMEANRLYHEWQYGQHQREKVLVIDEIQSKRHQEGREKGYANGEEKPLLVGVTIGDYTDAGSYRDGESLSLAPIQNERGEVVGQMKRRKAQQGQTYYWAEINDASITSPGWFSSEKDALGILKERVDEQLNSIPLPAPFEKDWPALTMKRMLRYAAEEGYDYIAWTTGEQQAERYNLGGTVDYIEVSPVEDGTKEVTIATAGADIYLDVDENGKIVGQQDNYGENLRGKQLSEIVGKEMAVKIMSATEDETIEGDGLRVGGEGMKGFYDDILPRWMNKYGKKWGVKVEDISLPLLGENAAAGAQKGLTMHSVRVTPEMKESVMQGQTMFRLAPNGKESNLTDEQWEQVRTPEFKAWFGDWENDPENASKVVDENGEPRVVYHGSKWDPLKEKPGKAVFDEDRVGENFDFVDIDWNFFFTASEASARGYGRAIPVFLNIRNPEVHTINERVSYEMDEEVGHDIVVTAHDAGSEYDEVTKVDKPDGVMYTIRAINVNDAEKRFGDAIKAWEGEHKQELEDEYNTLKDQADDIYKQIEDEYRRLYNELGFQDVLGTSYDEMKSRAGYVVDETVLSAAKLREGISTEKIDDLQKQFNDVDQKMFKIFQRQGIEGRPTYEEYEQFEVPREYHNTDMFALDNPNQIKSATANNGQFSTENNDIRFRLAGEEAFGDFHRKENQDRAADAIKAELNSRGFDKVSINRSDNKAGHSTYVNVYGSNWMPVAKIRISDHSVINTGRILDEYHVSEGQTAKEVADAIFGEKPGTLFRLGENGEQRQRTPAELVKRVQQYGLRGILDEDSAKVFWNDAYAMIPEEDRRKIVDEAFGKDLDIARAARTYVAALAKKGYAEDESGLLRYLADRIQEELGQALDENTLRYLIWRSANRYASNNILNVAEDIAMRRRLGVGEFADKNFPEGAKKAVSEAEGRIDKAEGDREEARQTTRRQARKTPLAALNQAMTAQRKYDQETVNSIVALAKSMIDKGNMDSVSSREMKRLMTIIKDANGRRPATVKASAQELLDFMVDHTIATEKNLLDKIVKVRTEKVRAPGVDVQAKLDIETQHIVKNFRDYYKMSEEDIRKAIDAKEDKLDDMRLSEAHKDEIRAELEGLNLALQYATEIAAREAEIKEIGKQLEDEEKKFKNLSEEEKKQTRQALNQQREAAEEMIRSKRIEEVDAYRRLRGDISQALDEGAEQAKTFLEAERERIDRIHHMANSDMQGVPDSVEDRQLKGFGKFTNSSFAKIFTAPLANLDQMLRTIGRKSPEGRGYLWNWMMGTVGKARDEEKLGIDAAEKKLNDKLREIFHEPDMSWNDLYQMERKMPKAKMRYLSANGQWVEKELTQGNLLYIYMVNKMSDGRMKLRQMNITDEDVAEIKKHLDPRFVKLADWIQEEFLPSVRDKYNETHKRLFGTSMASIENYFPLRIVGGVVEEKRNVGDQESKQLPSDITGAIIKRTINTKQIDIAGTDAFSLVVEHIREMEHWNAYAEASRDFSTLLKYKRFQNQLKQRDTVYGAGQDLVNLFWDTVNLAVGAYRPITTPTDKAFLKVAKGVTAAKISFRAYTALKQMLSWPAFLADTNTLYLAKNTSPHSWAKNWKWAMENLPNFKKRVESRKAGFDILEDKTFEEETWLSGVERWITQNGMFMNAFVDALTVSIGARSVYETKLKRYLEEGFSQEQAEEKAKFDAVTLFNETQQSSEKEFLSTMQANRTVWNVMWSAYRNSSMGYQRQLHQGLRTLGRMAQKGYKAESIAFTTKQLEREGLTHEQAAKAAEKRYNRAGFQAAVRVAVFGWAVQFAWNIGSHLAYLLFGDDPDEKKAMLKEDATHALVGGAIEGLAMGNVISEGLNMIKNGESLYNWDPTTLPLMSDIKSTISKMSSDPVAAVNDLVYLGAQIGLGTNPQTLSDAIVAIYDGCNGDVEMTKEVMICIMRILAVPQSQIDQMMIDEIGMTAEDAQKLTYEEVAKRYVDYKMKRNAPITGFAYSDEKREKREKALNTTFKKKFNERKKLKEEE